MNIKIGAYKSKKLENKLIELYLNYFSQLNIEFNYNIGF